MKKIILASLFLCCLCGCTMETSDLKTNAEQGLIGTFNYNNRIRADENTGILYYIFAEDADSKMCPYYSKNGKLCRLVDGKIVEVDTDENSN